MLKCMKTKKTALYGVQEQLKCQLHDSAFSGLQE